MEGQTKIKHWNNKDKKRKCGERKKKKKVKKERTKSKETVRNVNKYSLFSMVVESSDLKDSPRKVKQC